MTIFTALMTAPLLELPECDRCPHCARELAVYRFNTSGFTNRTWRCAEHGDVAPVRRAETRPDWSAA